MMWGLSGDTDDTNATVSILVDSERDGLQDGDCDRVAFDCRRITNAIEVIADLM